MRELHIKGEANRARKFTAFLSLAKVQSRRPLAPPPEPQILLSIPHRFSFSRILTVVRLDIFEKDTGSQLPAQHTQQGQTSQRFPLSMDGHRNVNNVHTARSCPPSPSSPSEGEGGQYGAGLPKFERGASPAVAKTGGTIHAPPRLAGLPERPSLEFPFRNIRGGGMWLGCYASGS
ncbi:hypothetical protein LZ31DRAFT_391728 [Colletotrichum somersetense]|nr:hypothetical protein LZ31DRAFT_391728 [Colletotrichum somersetense]